MFNRKQLVTTMVGAFLATIGFHVLATDFGPRPIDAPSDDPLIVACRNGDMEAVRTLVDDGESADRVDKEGLFPLLIASHKGDMALLHYLLGMGADVNLQSYLGPAIIVADSEEVALLLLDHGADLDLHLKNQPGPTVGEVLVFQAAANGWKDLLRRVYREFENPDVRDSYGRTPLYGAAQNGHIDIINTLLEWGAAVDTVDRRGVTPLMNAVRGGHLEAIAKLIGEGANVNHRLQSGFSVIDTAVECCWTDFYPCAKGTDHVPILDVLVRSGAEVELRTLDKLKDSSCQLEYEYLAGRFDHPQTNPPNTSFQRTLTRGGFGPLNSDR